MPEIKIYIPKVPQFDNVAFRSLGILRDLLDWKDRDKFETVTLIYDDEAEITDGSEKQAKNVYTYYTNTRGDVFYTDPFKAMRAANPSGGYVNTYQYAFRCDMYEEPEYPVIAEMLWSTKTNGYYCHLHPKPNVNGKAKRGKIFFPDQKWPDHLRCLGPAKVTITREMERYGFVRGEMVKFDELCAPSFEMHLRTSMVYDPDQPNGDLVAILHPVRGHYYAHKLPNGIYRFYMVNPSKDNGFTWSDNDFAWTDQYSDLIAKDAEKYACGTYDFNDNVKKLKHWRKLSGMVPFHGFMYQRPYPNTTLPNMFPKYTYTPHLLTDEPSTDRWLLGSFAKPMKMPKVEIKVGYKVDSTGKAIPGLITESGLEPSQAYLDMLTERSRKIVSSKCDTE